MECTRPSVSGADAQWTLEPPHLSTADETLQSTELRKWEKSVNIGGKPMHVLSFAHSYIASNLIIYSTVKHGSHVSAITVSCKIRTNV